MNKDDLIRMTRALSHRGPDAEGFYFNDGVGLGHKRLSIIDLSEDANQPMYSLCGKYVIVFNGEIYNFKDIAKELNRSFRTSSDTEVVLESFIRWGPACLQKFNGMFAFAIFNKETEKLFIARDRIGIKPIFYFWDGHSFAFSSELKALLKLTPIKLTQKINKIAINQFLNLGYITEPHTIYDKIFKFPSGSFLSFNGDNLHFQEYWSAAKQVKNNTITNEVEAKRALKELLIKSVKGRMISDVAFGTFLSGGIDSSLVTAVAQSISDKPINTFSIGFEYSKFDESKYAKKVAEHLGTKHHEYTVTEKEALDIIPRIVDIYDEPYADSSAVPTMMVSEIARKHVTMTLSGDGGDELFMGYGAYNWARRLNNPLIKIFRYPIALVLSQFNNRTKRAAKLFSYGKKDDIRAHIFSQEQYFFSQKEIKDIVNPQLLDANSFVFNEYNLSRHLTSEEKQAFFDLNYYLKDDLLVKVDRASMQHSLETRVPILDHNIVEFALNLSPSLKLKNGESKYLLKQVLYDYVPETLFKRPKWGFSIPLVNWLKNDLKFMQEEYLNEPLVNQLGIVSSKFVSRLLSNYNDRNQDYLYNRVWNLIMIHQFLSKNSLSF